MTRRSRDASPIGGRIGGVRCRALLFSTGTLVALVVRLTAPAMVSGGVTVGDLLDVAPPRTPTPVALVDGGARGGVRAGLAAASFLLADARVTRCPSPPDPVLAGEDGVPSGDLG